MHYSYAESHHAKRTVINLSITAPIIASQFRSAQHVPISGKHQYWGLTEHALHEG